MKVEKKKKKKKKKKKLSKMLTILSFKDINLLYNP